MQRFGNIFLKLFFCILLACGQPVYSQSVNELLQNGDRHFSKGNFTAAFQNYETILKKEQQASPNMLLKMAYIQEAFGNYPMALYYLNLAYVYFADRSVLPKMSSLAEEHKLKGYQFTDSDYFLSVFYANRLWLAFTAEALLAGVLLAIWWRKRRYNHIPVALLVVFIAGVALCYAAFNFVRLPQRAVVMGAHTYLMQAPSAAANTVEKINSGHRVALLEKTDIWYKIEWDGQIAYIRESDLLKIE